MTGTPKKTKTSRDIRNADKLLLWSRSKGICSKPGCDTECVIEATDKDKATTVGDMAHIFAHSNEGPRPNPDQLVEKRNLYDNLILLCGTHHKMVDKQENTYTVTELRDWKTNHEKFIADRIVREEFSHLELEQVTRFVARADSIPSLDFTLKTPLEKLRFNGLSRSRQYFITMGLVRVKEVETYIQAQKGIDSTYPERLLKPLKDEYNEKRTNGLDSDRIFDELHLFCSGNSVEDNIRMAGLAVIVYFFEHCDLFEK